MLEGEGLGVLKGSAGAGKVGDTSAMAIPFREFPREENYFRDIDKLTGTEVAACYYASSTSH